MADLLVVAVIIAFFALALLFVKALDHLVGPDEPASTDETEPAAAVGR